MKKMDKTCGNCGWFSDETDGFHPNGKCRKRATSIFRTIVQIAVSPTDEFCGETYSDGNLLWKPIEEVKDEIQKS